MMSPDTMGGAMMLSEAEQIRDILLPTQIELVESHEASDRLRLDQVRDELGYDSDYPCPAADLVDTRNEKQVMLTPQAVGEIIPVTESAAETTRAGRAAIAKILLGKDSRLMVIAGPCSIHDPESAIEYAERLVDWREEFGPELEIVMRTYVEKPRTELGWKGMIYDPLIDESHDINLGVILSRLVASQITQRGVPTAMERLNAATPQYFNGQVAYDAIGARNVADQKAREYASGTSSPVGIKNGIDGYVGVAAQAIFAANAPHSFLGMSENGLPTQVNTRGNGLAHLILRGGEKGPNYSDFYIADAKSHLEAKALLMSIVVDASHGNSADAQGNKNPDQQLVVVEDIVDQIGRLDEFAIKGIMLESHIVAGGQKPKPLRSGELVYGQSITDGCIDLGQTETALKMLAQGVRRRRVNS